MVIILFIIGLAFLTSINFLVTGLTKKYTKIANDKKNALIGSLETFVLLALFLLIVNKKITNSTIIIGCTVIETLFYIINYFYLKYSKNNLKMLIKLLIIIMFIPIIISIIIPIINSINKKCPTGYSYYEDNKCIKLYKMSSQTKDYINIDGASIPIHECSNKEYGYSDDGNCYKVKIIDVLK